MTMYFTQIYRYDNNKNIHIFIISWKKCLRLFNKENFSDYQVTCQKELYLLFEKPGNFFSQSEHNDRLDHPLLSFHLHLPCKDPPPPSTTVNYLKKSENHIKIKRKCKEEIERAHGNASGFMHSLYKNK